MITQPFELREVPWIKTSMTLDTYVKLAELMKVNGAQIVPPHTVYVKAFSDRVIRIVPLQRLFDRSYQVSLGSEDNTIPILGTATVIVTWYLIDVDPKRELLPVVVLP